MDFLISHTHIIPVYLIVTVFIIGILSGFVAWESWQTLKMQRGQKSRAKRASKAPMVKKDESAFDHIARRIHKIKIPPMIKLKASGIQQISVWVILMVAFVGGVFSGF